MIKKSKLKRCTICVNTETRPRITFDENGACNACQWHEEKRTIVDWNARWKELENFCEKYRSSSGYYDCLVPVSGGKDSSYVAYMMKHEMGMNPLCINVVPPLAYDIGWENLYNFMKAGYDCIIINPDPQITKTISRRNFIEHGQPLLSWITNVQVAVFKTAIKFNIPFVMFGEDGEVEYGGNTKLKNTPIYDIEHSIKIYLSGIDPDQYKHEFTEKDLYWWLYPSEEDFRNAGLAIAHWSYFEHWDPYKHYLLAKEKCGLKERKIASVGTYNNYAQTDTVIFDLHCYLMYLKFGFGRCTQDVGFDIRRGGMNRKQGIELVKKFDGLYPEPYIKEYLDYFEMDQKEFDEALDNSANKDLFEKVDGRWVPTFSIE
jgi:N-acetyl sugar amidotransferase